MRKYTEKEKQKIQEHAVDIFDLLVECCDPVQEDRNSMIALLNINGISDADIIAWRDKTKLTESDREEVTKIIGAKSEFLNKVRAMISKIKD
jgi:hypothetical protein